MIRLDLAEVAALTAGALADLPAGPPPVVTGPVVVDSREAGAGSLFVALAGERVDGHDFVAAAVGRGAAGVLAQRPVGVPAVVVADPVSALGALAAAVRDRLPDLVVVGVTGSSGKTSTKDLLAQLLERHGTTVAPVGSYNNEIGAPLTLLRCDPETSYLVSEMGARGPGHIATLASIVRPGIGVVLNIGAAHASEFGSREATAAAKGELVEALPATGLAVLNADDPLVAAMAGRTSARVVLHGTGSAATVRATGVTLDGRGRPGFTLDTPEGSGRVQLRLYGDHHVSNALAAAAVAREVGMSVPDVVAALSAAEPRSRWRMQVSERPDGVTVVNDAYNANPESVRAALKALVGMAGGRRTWAVLGEMLELGERSTTEHDAIGRLAVRLDIDRLVSVGAGARPLHLGAVLEGSWGAEADWVPDVDAAAELLTAQLEPGDIVLVKASRGVRLERVAAALLGADVGPAAHG